MNHRRITRFVFTTVSVLAALAMLFALVVASSQVDIPGPDGSGSFGSSVTVLPNGNLVICDPGYDAGTTTDVGAAYLYGGVGGTLISMLTGSMTGDKVCEGGVTVLANGNYLVSSPYWDNGAAWDAGAVTWGDGATGVAGPVSATNSLVGGSAGDQVGLITHDTIDTIGVDRLANGNYLVNSPSWDNGAAWDAGAVTWGDGTTGVAGPVSAANSLIGSTSEDYIGLFGAIALSNGNYVVSSPYWDNGAAADAGAVTWGDGTTGVAGPVSAANSLVRSSPGDKIYRVSPEPIGVIELSNGNYVVSSPYWDNGAVVNAGAATWADGRTGITGLVSITNSLVGSSLNDFIGYNVTALANGNYVVRSPFWDNGIISDAGAVTWGNGEAGISGPVSAANSLVGSSGYDLVGSVKVWELANGNYVVSIPSWDNFRAWDAGAVTWADGTTGVTGPISAANSLVGSNAGDQVGDRVTALFNGNYVVSSPDWDNGIGAVTWGDGAKGTTGTVNTANSLVGSSSEDHVGFWDAIALSNGNYVVSSPFWDNGAALDAGAVTWGNGTTGTKGTISAANSLVGSHAGDWLGGVIALSNGNYLVSSIYWDNDAVVDAGALTWGDGRTGVIGTISAANSLVGSSAVDQIGLYVDLLANGNYVVSSPTWDNGSVADAGAVTWGDSATGITGRVSAANSLVGSSPDDQVGGEFYFLYLHGVKTLPNGNYLVSSPFWDNGALADAGAVTWGDGTIGITGTISAANSLVGSTAFDQVGSMITPGYKTVNSVDVLANGNYVVSSPTWDNVTVVDAGAVTWADGTTGTRGPISAENSVRGEAIDGGPYMFYKYDPYNEQLAVSRPSDNTVTLFRPNRAPVAEASWPHIVARGALVRLDGSASYDPDGNLPLQFTWTQTGGSPVVLSGPHAVSPTFTAPDERTSLTFNLVVIDALGSSSQPAKAIVFVDPYQYFWPLMPEN